MTVRSVAARYLPRLLLAALVEWVGTGMFLAASAVYFVRVAGLSEQSVGFGFTLAGLAALGLAVPVGTLADRIGVRRAVVVLNLWRAATMCGYLLVDGWWGFLLVTAAAVTGDQSMQPLTQALVGERVAPEMRSRVLAVHRTALNVGISIGGLAATIPLATGTLAAYQWMLGLTACTFVLAAILIAGLPPVAVPVPAARPISGFRMLRDRRLLAFAGYDSLLALWLPIMYIAFPLWLTGQTTVPASAIGPLTAVNTVLCVLLQLPSSRLATDPRSAIRLYAAGPAFLALACLAFVTTPRLPTLLATAGFTIAIVFLTLAELCHVNASWTLSYAIAPEAQRAQFLSAFGLGRISSTRVYGPILMTGVVLTLGTAGWLALMCLFVLAIGVPSKLSRLIQ
ncbi:MFS transporter [Nocardia tenerifensis]|uniref:MFS transporter n=1 Tax=Nocardia tenerifensis TaxID=228006 RepID=A0A318JN40_9NOCA|nr:MFS transporter [Nocardia tenerifensis]PXX56301.1 MFS transporter [Nocardia tenerifensis]